LSESGIKEKINDLRELLKGLITLIIALLSGEAILVYQVLNKKAEVVSIILGLIGIISLFLVTLYGKAVWEKLDEYERRL